MIREAPVQTLTVTPLAEVVRKGVAAEEADERVKLSNAVLQRRTRETPAVLRLQPKSTKSKLAQPELLTLSSKAAFAVFVLRSLML